MYVVEGAVLKYKAVDYMFVAFLLFLFFMGGGVTCNFFWAISDQSKYLM